MRGVFISGGTGSIGSSALSVIRQNTDSLKLIGFSYNNNHEKAKEIISEFKPKYVFSNQLTDLDVPNQITDEDDLMEVFCLESIEFIICGVSGFEGLKSTMLASKSGKKILLANKESIVTAGSIFLESCKKYDSQIFPIDSEHNAVLQCLDTKSSNSEISKVMLTASGGPFYGMSMDQLKEITPEQAANHPNWKMGTKISIDSATLMNKCLEVIEAAILFKIESDKINAVIHPQSILHAMVTYVDGSSIAHLSNPSMEVPIANMLRGDNRISINFEELLTSERALEFFPIPHEKESLFEIASDVIKRQGNRGAIFNAINEVAVQQFRDSKISFLDIDKVIKGTYSVMPMSKLDSIEEVYFYDQEARIKSLEMIKSLSH
ncbi:MAG: 1-deoxy-D-xylulose-5-phosphate reductoisomerase [SAR86 cluster bacterium]|uniref:1-deoxy-D-xylulose 5-phosphate reductoisomerase n=1 Tax=SAR86 cluster bacterium TaxID=2030880 RepID=A0A368BRP8_9GAMM|nr:MAG: 1-deoxy-D-xylulose-5-phosphate reductoisomerase [SAR86 cluster bacterium]